MVDTKNPCAQYVPPKVWSPATPSGGSFANINRPVAGPTHTKELPVGKHPLQLYSLGTPNGQKVTIMLEELLAAGHTGAEYDAWLIKINEGDQFGSGFVDINPNSKIPALVDRSGPEPVRVFESGAILLYLADKSGKLTPRPAAARYECLQWVFFQVSGIGPMFGQLGFFHKFAGREWEDKRPRDRYVAETRRLLGVLEQRLASRAWIMGDQYSIADIAIFPMVRNLVGFYEARDLVHFDELSNVPAWLERGLARPAVERGLQIPSRG